MRVTRGKRVVLGDVEQHRFAVIEPKKYNTTADVCVNVTAIVYGNEKLSCVSAFRCFRHDVPSQRGLHMVQSFLEMFAPLQEPDKKRSPTS